MIALAEISKESNFAPQNMVSDPVSSMTRTVDSGGGFAHSTDEQEHNGGCMLDSIKRGDGDFVLGEIAAAWMSDSGVGSGGGGGIFGGHDAWKYTSECWCWWCWWKFVFGRHGVETNIFER